MQKHSMQQAAASPAAAFGRQEPLACPRFSRHAMVREQQRGLSRELVALLLAHGEHTPAGGGADIVHLPRRRWRELASEVGAATLRRHTDRAATVYAIVAGDGTVVTIGHRRRRIGRP